MSPADDPERGSKHSVSKKEETVLILEDIFVCGIVRINV
jgi:hypothetical protein